MKPPPVRYKSGITKSPPPARTTTGYYKAGTGTVHRGSPSKYSGKFVATCSGRTMSGKACSGPATCRSCG